MIASPLLTAAVAMVLLPQSTTSDIEELKRLETVWNEAHERGDAEALDGLWADDFTATVPNMVSMTKSDSIGVWRSGRMRFDGYDSTDVQVRPYGDAAVVSGRIHRKRIMNDRTIEDDWSFTKVYVRQSGRWRVVVFHASDAPR